MSPDRTLSRLLFSLLGIFLLVGGTVGSLLLISGEDSPPLQGGHVGVLWSFDNRWGVLAIQCEAPSDSPPGPFGTGLFYLHCWLVDSRLAPVKHLFGRSAGLALYPQACFSRDGKYLFYIKIDPTSLTGEMVRLELEPAPSQESLVWSDDTGVLFMVAGEGDAIIVTIASDVDNLYRVQAGKVEPMLVVPKDSVPLAITPFITDAAHRDWNRDGKLLYKKLGDNSIWEIPPNARNIPVQKIKRNPLDPPDLSRVGADGKIQVLYAKHPYRRIQLASGKTLGEVPLSDFKLDRTELLWLSPKDRSLQVITPEGRIRTVLRHLPESEIVIVNYNETLGVACLAGRDTLYIVNCQTGEVENRPRLLYDPSN